MEIQEIELIVGKNGDVNLHIHGVQGKRCIALTSDLEAALGDVVFREMTSKAGDEPPIKTPRQISQKASKK